MKYSPLHTDSKCHYCISCGYTAIQLTREICDECNFGDTKPTLISRDSPGEFHKSKSFFGGLDEKDCCASMCRDKPFKRSGFRRLARKSRDGEFQCDDHHRQGMLGVDAGDDQPRHIWRSESHLVGRVGNDEFQRHLQRGRALYDWVLEFERSDRSEEHTS